MNVTDLTDLVGLTDSRKSIPVEPEKAGIDRENLGPKKSLLRWTATPRLESSKLDPRYRRTLLVAGVILAFLFVSMQEYWLILVVASLIFISQALAKSNKEEFHYELNTHGLSINSDFYYWDELKNFFFSKMYMDETLAITLKQGIPSRLFVAFKAADKQKLIEIMNAYVQFLPEEPLNFVDKAYFNVMDKFDFEKKK